MPVGARRSHRLATKPRRDGANQGVAVSGRAGAAPGHCLVLPIFASFCLVFLGPKCRHAPREPKMGRLDEAKRGNARRNEAFDASFLHALPRNVSFFLPSN
jgi:hypothetical protein